MQIIPTKVDGTSTLAAAEFNQIPLELTNAIASAGLTPSNGDLNQLAKALAAYTALANFYTDSGSADTYVLTALGSLKSPTTYSNGMRVRFRPGNTNTGASTVNVAGLGVIDIKKADGSTDPAAGDLTASTEVDLTYDGSVFRIATPSVTIAAGQVIQVVHTVKTDVFSTTSTSFVDVTGLSASITPSSSSNKVLVLGSVNGSGLSDGLHVQLLRGSTEIVKGDAGTGQTRTSTSLSQANSYNTVTAAINHLDSPATTSATTYKIQVASMFGGSCYINRSTTDTGSSGYPRTTSSITLLEVKG